MINFDIRISKQADNDISNLDYFITDVCKSPLTASNYVKGIYNEISKLKRNANVFKISTLKSVLQYGHNARRINYKKIAIIYTIHNDVVIVRRILPGGIITGI